ncbi:hypothetical protein [Eggerthella lenta]|jgi:hypothetical protein|uniref:hypothetical protein n=1 Tax=Eggerthella lenta TaxID=84112 RepID=UPI000DF70A11|nr:hypothetical protein [Eggerthella lenta]RDB76374.1 hypothetical protein C1874_04825 [Eggerthella lenta]DAL81942.1 MAG TPA: hypothetical protein [Caudoviricetes sp.]
MARRKDAGKGPDFENAMWVLWALSVLALLAMAIVSASGLAIQASEAQEVQVSPARTDGPIYDLPEGIGQEIVCDEHNREYLLLTTEQGGVFLMPYLDENGEQEIMPQA